MDRRLACLVVLMALGCEQGDSASSPPAATAAGQPQLVVLYAPCTVNRDHLSPYNPKVRYTPNLERFSRDSVVFTKHRTETGTSGVAFASIFSGRQAPGHGIFTHPTRLWNSVYLISEAFADNRYDVLFWNFHAMASDSLNYAQGIPEQNVYRELLEPRERTLLGLRKSKFEKVIEKVKADSRYKALVLANFTVTHGPYSEDHLEGFCKAYAEECTIIEKLGRERFRQYADFYHTRFVAMSGNYPRVLGELPSINGEIADLIEVIEVLYKSNINYLDRLFGDLLDALDAAGVADRALVVFSADHGETLFNEHAIFKYTHTQTVDGDTLNVPLIIRGPQRGIAPQQYDAVTRSIDVFPTVAGLAHVAMPDDVGITGRDLSKAVRGEEQKPPLLAYSHSAMMPKEAFQLGQADTAELKRFYPTSDIALTWVAVRDGDMVWKSHIEDGKVRFEAFDVAADPHELHDIYDVADPHHTEMTSKLISYKTELEQAYQRWASLRRRPGAPSAEESEANLERLRVLGYR